MVIRVEADYRYSLIQGLLDHTVEGLGIDQVQCDPVISVLDGLSHQFGLGRHVNALHTHPGALYPHLLGRVLHALLYGFEKAASLQQVMNARRSGASSPAAHPADLVENVWKVINPIANAMNARAVFIVQYSHEGV